MFIKLIFNHVIYIYHGRTKTIYFSIFLFARFYESLICTYAAGTYAASLAVV